MPKGVPELYKMKSASSQATALKKKRKDGKY